MTDIKPPHALHRNWRYIAIHLRVIIAGISKGTGSIALAHPHRTGSSWMRSAGPLVTKTSAGAP